MYRDKKYFHWRSLILLAVPLLLSTSLCALLFNVTGVTDRLSRIPRYAQNYYYQLLPKPVLPTPPAVSAIDPKTLLDQATATAEPMASTPVSYAFDVLPLTPTPQVEAVISSTATPFLRERIATPVVSATVVVEPSPSTTTTLQTTDATSSTATRQPTVAPISAIQLLTNSVEAIAPAQPAVRLTGIAHEWQKWNNCGPSTVLMGLRYFGHDGTQIEAAQFLKPTEDDRNVSPDELARYAQHVGYHSFVGVGGSIDLLQQFLSNGFPVIVEFWTEHDDEGGMGHYRLLTGYDNEALIGQDSYHGIDVRTPLAEFDNDWRVFNRTYIVVFPPEQAFTAYALAGPTVSAPDMYRGALHTAQQTAELSPTDPFAWFNIGTNYARLGETARAASAFDQARRLGLPYRMFWYQFEIFAVYLAEGRYDELIALTDATLAATRGHEEMYHYRGLAREALGQTEAAQQDFLAAFNYNPNNSSDFHVGAN